MNEFFMMPIAELAKKLDVPAHTLRYWEKEFPALVQPVTGAGGRRFYRQNVVDNIVALKRYLYADGYTIDGVKKLISTGGFDSRPGDIQQLLAAASAAPVRDSAAKAAAKKSAHKLDDAIELLKQAAALLDDN